MSDRGNTKAQSKATLSRRQMVAVASLPLLGGLPIERFAHAVGGSDTLKIGLIGCGNRGGGAAFQALKADRNTRLVAMGDVFPDQLETCLTKLRDRAGNQVSVARDRRFVGLDACRHVAELSDVVILATPPGFRPDHFSDAIEGGCHVFMEKPLAVDGPGVRKILETALLADEKSLKVGVGFQRRHQVAYIETIKRLQDGAIGKLLSARTYTNVGGMREPRVTRADVDSELDYQLRNWSYYNWLGGDPITEQHVQNLDVINWLKGGFPVMARGMGGREVRSDAKYGDIYDHHCVEYQYADGSWMVGQCRQIRGCWNSTSEHVQGAFGRSDISRFQIESRNGSWSYRRRKSDLNPFQQEHNDLFAAIRGDRPYNEAYTGAKTSLSAIMGRMASYSGGQVNWDQVLNSDLQMMPTDLSLEAQLPRQLDENGSYPIPVPGDELWQQRIV